LAGFPNSSICRSATVCPARAASRSHGTCDSLSHPLLLAVPDNLLVLGGGTTLYNLEEWLKASTNAVRARSERLARRCARLLMVVPARCNSRLC
jgi:hypothetical protein